MNIELVRININKAEKLWKMQVDAFQELYKKYKDTETSPATEPVERIIERLKQDFTYYYFIRVDGVDVGAIRVIDFKDDSQPKRISPIFILNEFRRKGYAQKAIRLAEDIHGNSNWELETILQEQGNCSLYEKMDYHQTGKTEQINDRLTLVFYKKD
jgi:predicted acetyltransferase